MVPQWPVNRFSNRWIRRQEVPLLPYYCDFFAFETKLSSCTKHGFPNWFPNSLRSSRIIHPKLWGLVENCIAVQTSGEKQVKGDVSTAILGNSSQTSDSLGIAVWDEIAKVLRWRLNVLKHWRLWYMQLTDLCWLVTSLAGQNPMLCFKFRP